MMDERSRSWSPAMMEFIRSCWLFHFTARISGFQRRSRRRVSLNFERFVVARCSRIRGFEKEITSVTHTDELLQICSEENKILESINIRLFHTHTFTHRKSFIYIYVHIAAI